MGQAPSQSVKVPFKPIAPLPGTYGTATRKKNHVTVYSPQQHLFCYIQISPDWTVQDLKQQLQLKFSHHPGLCLYLGEVLLGDSDLLTALQVTERSLLRMEFSEEPIGLDVEYCSRDGTVLSAPCSLKDSAVMGSTTPDSTQSLPCKQPWEIDFSVYALPEAGLLATPTRRKSKAKAH